jgi:hypothetical protein
MNQALNGFDFELIDGGTDRPAVEFWHHCCHCCHQW